MSKKLIPLLLTVLSVCTLAGCSRDEPPAPAPDLTGEWAQQTDGEWYHVATISGEQIEIFWYLPATGRKDLYWSGSFTPPSDGTEPYSWVSGNNYTEDELNAQYHFHRASREESKTFTYKDGKLSYIVTAGHLRMTYVLERVAEPKAEE